MPRTGVSSDDIAAIVNETAALFFRATLEAKAKGRFAHYLERELVHRHAALIAHTEVVWNHGCDDE